MLRATDNTNSVVRFLGDVSLNGVAWEDLGARQFRVGWPNGSPTTRLLGDRRVPAAMELLDRLHEPDGGFGPAHAAGVAITCSRRTPRAGNMAARMPSAW